MTTQEQIDLIKALMKFTLTKQLFGHTQAELDAYAAAAKLLHQLLEGIKE